METSTSIVRLQSIYTKLKSVKAAHGTSWPLLLSRAFSYRVFEGILLDEQIATGLLFANPIHTPANYIAPRLEVEPLLRKLNRHPTDILSDKTVFAQFIKGVDVQVPKTYLVFYSLHDSEYENSFGVTDDLKLIASPEDWLNYIHHHLPDAFIVKPATGQGGKGIHVYRRQGKDSFLCQKQSVTADEMVRRIVTDEWYGTCLIQELARNHPSYQAISGSNALECLRVLTARTRSRGIQVYSTEARFTVDVNAEVDNFQGGRSGNILCKVANDTGKIQDAFIFDTTKVTYRHISHHPNTQHPLVGWAVPEFNAAHAAAIRAHTSMASFAIIGWDIAITERGPIIIEGNHLWGGSSRTMPWLTRMDIRKMLKLINS